MNAALWGAVCALNLGTADFMARFSSQALGYRNALFGVFVAGVSVLTGYVVWVQPAMVWTWSGAWLVALHGLAMTAMTLLLYLGLARGPVTVVAPIVAAHPALVLLLEVVLGARPSWLQWAAMAATIAGVIVVAYGAEEEAEHAEPDGTRGGYTAGHVKVSIAIAAAASVCYAVLVSAGQYAVPVYGQLQTMWLGRLVSLGGLLLVFLALRERPRVTGRWWPYVIVQGLLDTGGYLALLAGSGGPRQEIAAVTASTFGAVTTLLAFFILRERIVAAQWAGLAAIFGGVAVLSGS
jgi:drug/metabolite transporter (DMT)-like permease